MWAQLQGMATGQCHLIFPERGLPEHYTPTPYLCQAEYCHLSTAESLIGATNRHVLDTCPESPTIVFFGRFADVAQLAEQLICNQQVRGSIPLVSSVAPTPNVDGPRLSARRGSVSDEGEAGSVG